MRARIWQRARETVPAAAFEGVPAPVPAPEGSLSAEGEEEAPRPHPHIPERTVTPDKAPGSQHQRRAHPVSHPASFPRAGVARILECLSRSSFLNTSWCVLALGAVGERMAVPQNAPISQRAQPRLCEGHQSPRAPRPPSPHPVPARAQISSLQVCTILLHFLPERCRA